MDVPIGHGKAGMGLRGGNGRLRRYAAAAVMARWDAAGWGSASGPGRGGRSGGAGDGSAPHWGWQAGPRDQWASRWQHEPAP